MKPELGDIYKDKNGRIWKVTGYCPEPSVTLVCIEHTNIRDVSPMTIGVSGLLFTKLTKLVPEK